MKPCLGASEEQKAKCREALEENNSKKVEKLFDVARLKDDVIMSLSTHETKKKKKKFLLLREGQGKDLLM